MNGETEPDRSGGAKASPKWPTQGLVTGWGRHWDTRRQAAGRLAEVLIVPAPGSAVGPSGVASAAESRLGKVPALVCLTATDSNLNPNGSMGHPGGPGLGSAWQLDVFLCPLLPPVLPTTEDLGVGALGSPTCDRCGEGNARFTRVPGATGTPCKALLGPGPGCFPSNPVNGQRLCVLLPRRKPARGPVGTCLWSDTWQGAEWEQVAPKGLLEAHTCDLGTPG